MTVPISCRLTAEFTGDSGSDATGAIQCSDMVLSRGRSAVRRAYPDQGDGEYDQRKKRCEHVALLSAYGSMFSVCHAA